MSVLFLFNDAFTMFKPSLEEFKAKAKQGNLIPVYKEVLADLDTPVSAYMKIRGDTPSFLLESVEGGDKWAPVSLPLLRYRQRKRPESGQ